VQALASKNKNKAALQRGPIVYCIEEMVIQGRSVRAIPYYAWSNRGVGKMRVWMPEK
jgi:hypothetical protein